MGVSKDMRIGEVMRNYPVTRNIFMRYGICDCCGGDLSIEETARAKNLDIDVLLRNLNSVF